jgi:hypothetical protein
MTSFRQIEANRRNAQSSTGPKTETGKQRSRGNAVRHGLTAETVIGALEDAKDYEAFEAAIIGDYDAQSAVERELVLRLASLLWRLRRASAMESGLFEIQADQLRDYRQARKTHSDSGDIIRGMFLGFGAGGFDRDAESHGTANTMEAEFGSVPAVTNPVGDPSAELARCFLRLANLPNFVFDRLGRYEAAIWRQVAQVLFALDSLDRHKPQERRRLPFVGSR